MGLFRGIKNTFKKSEAAVVVQNLLEMQAKTGVFELDPASTATKLVDAVWTESPQIFDGRFGQRPHKLTVAAAAFAHAIDQMHESNLLANSFVLALGNILNELSVNGRLYPLNSIDEQLLEAASGVFISTSERLNASPLGQEVADLIASAENDWEEWLAHYKEEAGKQNPALAPNPDGFSLIDIMDDEPLKRAFRDGIEPRSLGRDFAEQFDPMKFGIK